MSAKSASDFPSASIINDRNLFRIDESVSQGKSLNKKQQKTLHSKPYIADSITELEELSKTAPGPPVIQVGSLQVPLHAPTMSVSKPVQEKDSAPLIKEERLIMNENGTEESWSDVEPLDKGRYLCISDGFVICCLDLKQSEDHKSKEDCSNPPPLPKTSTLNLLEMGFPASIGFFRLGSDVYMIGGQQFPCLKKDRDLWGMKLLHFLYREHGGSGSSGNTYRLSLANGSLSLSKCSSLGQLNKPKFWPIVTMIEDQIHVIECFPEILKGYFVDAVPSHEVFNLKDPACGWIELSPPRIENHFVVGQRIFAKPYHTTDHFSVFDSTTNEWELHQNPEASMSSHRINHITDSSFYHDFRLGWVAREFMAGELSDPHYVFIAVQNERYPVKKQVLNAYLINVTGQALCYQALPQLLKGFTRLFVVSHGTLINVDAEGKTMCLVLQVKTKDVFREELLFISTFTLEEVESAGPVVSRHSSPRDMVKRVDVDFVKVVVKSNQVYKTDAYLEEKGDIGKSLRLQACFL